MLFEIQMARQLLKKEGLASVLRHSANYIAKWPRYLIFPYRIKWLDSQRHVGLHEWVDFTFTCQGDLIKPLQVRSEILQLINMIHPCPPEWVLEIGTSNGGTLFLWSRIAAQNARLISIDLPLGRYGGGYPAWKRYFYRSFARSNQDIVLIRADSHAPATREKIAAILQENRLDLLFIDGDHSYEGVTKDFAMYEPFVKNGGTIIFHDIVPNREGTDYGVARYWNDIKHRYRHLEFIEDPDQQGAGLGVIFKGEQA